MNSRSKRIVLFTLLAIIILVFVLPMNQFSQEPISTNNNYNPIMAQNDKNSTQHTSKTMESNIKTNSMLGNSRVFLQGQERINTDHLTLNTTVYAYGTNQQIKYGEIKISKNKLMPLDKDIPNHELLTSEIKTSFILNQQLSINGILIPLNSSFNLNDSDLVSLKISKNQDFTTNLVSITYNAKTFSDQGVNYMYLSFSTVFGGPGSVTLLDGTPYYLLLNITSQNSFVFLISRDMDGSNESKVFVKSQNNWEEQESIDLQIFFSTIISYSSVNAPGGSFNVNTDPGIELFEATYYDNNNNNYYDPSIASLLVHTDLKGLTSTPSKISLVKSKSSMVNLTLSKNNIPLSSQNVSVYYATNTTLLLSQTKKTGNNGILTLYFPQDMAENFSIIITCQNASITITGETIPPDISISNFTAKGQYGSGSWNQTIVKISFHAYLEPLHTPLTSSKVEIYEEGILKLTGYTNSEGYFTNQYVSSLSPGNYSTLQIKLYSSQVNRSFTENLLISSPQAMFQILTPLLTVTDNTELIIKMLNQNNFTLPGFDITLNYRGNNYTKTTDSNGIVRLMLDPIVPGINNVTIFLDTQKNYPETITTLFFNVTTTGIYFSLQTYDYYVQLNNEFSITGRVLNQDNQPVKEVKIMITPENQGNIILNITNNPLTNNFGEFNITLLLSSNTTPFKLILRINGVNDSDYVWVYVWIHLRNITTHISIDVTNTTYPEMPLITGVLFWGENTPLSNATITISYENNTITVTTNETGHFQAIIQYSYAHSEKVVILFSGLDTKYLPSNSTPYVELSKATPQIITNNYYEHVSGQYLQINGNVTIQNKGVSNLKITLSSSVGDYYDFTQDKGGFSFNFNFTRPIGSYELVLVTNDTQFLSSNSITITVNVTKLKVSIIVVSPLTKIFSYNNSFVFKFIDIYGNPIIGTNTSITITNNKIYSITNQSGIANFIIPKLIPGNYSTKVFIQSTETTINCSKNYEIAINPIQVDTKISYDDLIEYSNTTIIVTLALKNVDSYHYYVSVWIDDQLIQTIQVTNNSFSFKVSLGAGKHVFRMTDDVNTVFTPSNYVLNVKPQALKASVFQITNFNYTSECAVLVNITNSIDVPIENASLILKIIKENQTLLTLYGITPSNGTFIFTFEVPANWLNYVDTEFVFQLLIEHLDYPSSIQQQRKILRKGIVNLQIIDMGEAIAGKSSSALLSMNKNVSYTLFVYLNNSLYSTINYDKTPVNISLFFESKGTYNLTIILNSPGFERAIISQLIDVRPQITTLLVIDSYAQYLNNSSWMLLRALLDNNTPGSNLEIIVKIGNTMVFQGKTNESGFLYVPLPADQWGTITFTIYHSETQLTSQAIIQKSLNYEKAHISLQPHITLIQDSPVLLVKAFVSGWSGTIPYSFTLYWKTASSSIWNSVTANFTVPVLIPINNVNETFDFYIDPTLQFNSYNTSYQLQNKENITFTINSQLIVFSNLNITLKIGDYPIISSSIEITITSFQNISSIVTTTNSKGILIIPSEFFNKANYHYTIILRFPHASWISETNIILAMQKRTLSANITVEKETEIKVDAFDALSTNLFSEALNLSLYYNDHLIFSQQFNKSITIPFSVLPNTDVVELQLKITDANNVYEEYSVILDIERILNITVNISDVTIQFGDNYSLSLEFDYTYYSPVLTNANISIFLENGDLLGSFEGVQKSVTVLLKTDTLLPDTYSVFLRITLQNGTILLEKPFTLTVVSESVEPQISIINNGYSSNITIVIKVLDDDMHYVTSGRLVVEITENNSTIYYATYYLQQIGTSSIVIILQNNYVNTTLQINAKYYSGNLLLNTYTNTEKQLRFDILPEKLTIIAKKPVEYGTTIVTAVVLGEHNQTVPNISIINEYYGINTTSDKNGIVLIKIPLYTPGNHSVELFLVYPSEAFSVTSELRFTVIKRNISLQIPSVIKAEYGEILTLTLFQPEDETFTYLIYIYENNQLIFSTNTTQTSVNIDTSLLPHAGNFTLKITRVETKITTKSTTSTILSIKKGETSIFIRTSKVSKGQVYLNGIVNNIAGKNVEYGEIKLKVYEGTILIKEFYANVSINGWEFSIYLQLKDDKSYTLKLFYEENENYLSSSIIALQLTSDSVNESVPTSNSGLLNSIISLINPVIVSIIAVPSIGVGIEKLLRRRQP